MVKSYDSFYLPIIRQKMGEMFEAAIYYEKLTMDGFCALFLKSPISHYLEIADPRYALGKSSLELLAEMLNKDPEQVELNTFATPEFWTGYILAFIQWHFNKPFSYILEKIDINTLSNLYFPYHEMDVNHILDIVKKKLDIKNPLTELRKKKELSQDDLSKLSGVPLRTIRGYEQGTLSIEKAQADTLYAISKVLGCTIEDLIS